MKNKIVVCCFFAFFSMITTPGWCASYGGHISWLTSLTGAEGSGTATLNLQVPSSSSASIEKGNVWVSWGADAYQVNTNCIKWSGSAYIDVEYKGKNGSWLGGRMTDFPASFFVDQAHATVQGNVWTNLDAVRINSINSNSLQISNICEHNEAILIKRAISIGENHWDMKIEGTIPFTSQCTVSVDALVDLGEIKYGELVKSSGVLLQDRRRDLPIKWHCTGDNLNEKITIKPEKVSHGCVGTNNDALRFCLFQENSTTAIDLTQGSASFHPPKNGESANIVVVPGAGGNPQPGESRGIMTIKIEPQ